MNIFIFGANWYNHGDESAIRAMIDELLCEKKVNIKIQFNQNVRTIPYDNIEIINGIRRPSIKKHSLRYLIYKISIENGGKFVKLLKDTECDYSEILEAIKWADLAVFAPGGPTIGDIYRQYQLLDYMKLMDKHDVPYVFYAPSMGPFSRKRKLIKSVVDKAEYITFREEISHGYYKELSPNKATSVTLDSAFQHEPSFENYQFILEKDNGLKHFLETHNRIVGVTITDLQWNSRYMSNEIENHIESVFDKFLRSILKKKCSILFIPQLFGLDNDSEYMQKFLINDNCYIVNPKYDCYFQQCLISKLYAVVGMRYHSNIFSAKMGTPFISIAYEQKMSGFMKKAGISEYCIQFEDLSSDALNEKFEYLEETYDYLKNELVSKHDSFVGLSYQNTINLINEITLILEREK